jgi:hypothetical protein
MSRIIHCGWCGCAGHRVNHCNHPSLRELYKEHKSNGKQYYMLQMPIIDRYNLYILSMSKYSLKQIKAIASFMNIKRIYLFARRHLIHFICKEILNNYRYNHFVKMPKIEYAINPIMNMNCCQIIESNVEANEEVSECCICYNNVKEDMFVKFNCNHKTCLDCFKQIITYKSQTSHFPTMLAITNLDAHKNIISCSSINCPMCRSVIDTVYSEKKDTLSNIKNEYIQKFKVKQDFYVSYILQIPSYLTNPTSI